MTEERTEYEELLMKAYQSFVTYYAHLHSRKYEVSHLEEDMLLSLNNLISTGLILVKGEKK